MLSIMGKLIDEFNSLSSISDFVRISDDGQTGNVVNNNNHNHHKLSPVHCRLQLINTNAAEVINLDDCAVAYRAEGNANIVLSLPKMRKVLRIRKSLIANSNQTDTDQSYEELIRSIEYTMYLSSLIGFSFPNVPKFVYLQVTDLNLLNQDMLEFRPVERLEKEVRTRIATLYPDVALLPDELDPTKMSQKFRDTFCVEVKPKQGWSFFDEDPQDVDFHCNPDYLFDYDDVKKCRYCSFQYFKLKKSSIKKVSKYCPLDLFSGQSIRMLRAIKGLIGSPQNNLRVFRNGNLIYGDTIEKRDLNKALEDLLPHFKTNDERKTVFMNLIKEVLLKDFSTACDIRTNRMAIKLRKDRKKNKNTIHKRNCEPIKYKYLPDKCALKKILNVQLLAKQSLAKLDFKDFQELADQNCYIDKLLKQSQHSMSLVDPNGSETFQLQERVNHLSTAVQYMLGATALDCSLMICFSRISYDEVCRMDPIARNHILQINDMMFIANITIMDLDPKSTNHFEKYIKQINDSHFAYKEFLKRF